MDYSDRIKCLRRFFLGTDTSVLAEESQSLPIEIVSSSESNLNGATLVCEPVGVEKPSRRDLSQGVCKSCRSSAVSSCVAGLAPKGITPGERAGEGRGSLLGKTGVAGVTGI